MPDTLSSTFLLPFGAFGLWRPSGTEPKAKFYVTVRKSVPEGISDASLYELKQQTDAEASDLMTATHALARGIAGAED